VWWTAAASAGADPIRLVFVGPADGSEWRGVTLGLEEADLLGGFTGHDFEVQPRSADDLEKEPSPPPAAVLAAVEGADLRRLVAAPGLASVAVLNLRDEDDGLRRSCRPDLLHVVPSRAMKAAAVAQWRQRHPEARVEARAWHPDFVKYAARDLNKRFLRSQGVAMDDGAWAGWAAVKMVAETVARTGSAEPAGVLAYLRQELGFDGQKGVAHTFHETGQLRQPLLLVEGGRLVGEAPVRGVADVEDLDSLGLDACEPTHRAFVSNEDDGTVTVIDVRTGEVEATVAVGNRPRGLGFSPDRSLLYVALGEDDAIGVVDVHSLELVKKVPSGSDPEAFAVHSGGHLYLSNEDANLATVLDPASGRILAEIPVGIEPEGVGVSPDGKRVMVTSESTSMVHVIAVPEHRVVANVLVGARPREVTFTADGRWAFVTSELGGEVARLDVATNQVTQTVKLDIPKAKPKGIVLSRDEKRLFVSLGRAATVAVLDAESLEVRHLIAVGGRVWGLALTGDGSRLYACNGIDDTVSVIDTGSFEVTATIATGGGPWGVVIDDGR
jgi:PQQ-dependent catabolism-associated beta-propeller protein